jgi:hypothetical protein
MPAGTYVIEIFVIGPLLTELTDFTVSYYKKLCHKNILKDFENLFPENEGQIIKSVASSGPTRIKIDGVIRFPLCGLKSI